MTSLDDTVAVTRRRYWWDDSPDREVEVVLVCDRYTAQQFISEQYGYWTSEDYEILDEGFETMAGYDDCVLEEKQ